MKRVSFKLWRKKNYFQFVIPEECVEAFQDIGTRNSVYDELVTQGFVPHNIKPGEPMDAELTGEDNDTLRILTPFMEAEGPSCGDSPLKSPCQKKMKGSVTITPIKRRKEGTSGTPSCSKKLNLPPPCGPELSSSVLVEKLPPGYSDQVLLYILNAAVAELGLLNDNEECAVEVLPRDATSALVKFSTVEGASEACLCEVKYKGDQLMLTQEKASAPVAAASSPKLSSTVLVEKLPPGYSDQVLLYILNAAVAELGLLNDNEECAVEVLPRDATSALVKFSTVERASEACLCEVKYKGNQLTLMQEEATAPVSPHPPHVPKTLLHVNLPESNETWGLSGGSDTCWGGEDLFDGADQVPSGLDSQDAFQLPSDHLTEDADQVPVVTFTQVPSTYTKDTFMETIMFKAQEELGDLVGVDVVSSVLHIPEENSVAIKFSSSEMAQVAARWQTLSYQGVQLRIVGLGDNEPDEPEFMGLDGDAAQEIFLKLLLQYRGDFPKNGSHDGVFVKLRPILRLRGVVASVAEMRTKRTRMRDNFRKWEREQATHHHLYKPSAVAFGKAPLSSLSGTCWETTDVHEVDDVDEATINENQYLDDLIQFSAGATFTNNSSLALMRILVDNKENYLKYKEKDDFWKSVSRALYKKKYVFPFNKCKEQEKALTKEYKKHKVEGGRTGAAGPLVHIPCPITRDVMELTGELHAQNPAINPKYLLSAGVEDIEVGYEAEESNPGGRGRPAVLTGKLKRKLLKEQMEERRLKADEEAAQGIASIGKYFSSKMNVS